MRKLPVRRSKRKRNKKGLTLWQRIALFLFVLILWGILHFEAYQNLQMGNVTWSVNSKGQEEPSTNSPVVIVILDIIIVVGVSWQLILSRRKKKVNDEEGIGLVSEHKGR